MTKNISRRTFAISVAALVSQKAEFTMATAAPAIPKATKPILGPASQLIHCTCLVRCENASGQRSSGTTFLFHFFREEGQSTPCLVTNKHVIAGATKGTIIFTIDKDGMPDYGNNFTLNLINFESGWILHPDDKIDLAILPINPYVEQMAAQGKKPFLIGLDESLVPTKEQRNQLTPLEDLLIVGYPDGISDEINNTPVTKRGMTATPPNLDFGGEPKFLIDAAIFPGSSGSPCFIYNSGAVRQPDGTFGIGVKVVLIGVVFAVAQHAVDGNIHLVPAPTQSRTVATSLIPNNLGVCINSDKILDFEPILEKMGAKVPKDYKMRSAR